DGGTTWKIISGKNSGFPEGNSLGRIGLAVYPKDPNIVYAVLDNQTPRTEVSKVDTSKYVLKDFRDLTKEKFSKLDERKMDTFLKHSGLGNKYKASQIKEMVENGELMPTAIHDYFFT